MSRSATRRRSSLLAHDRVVLFVRCPHGFEDLLEREVVAAGGHDVRLRRGGVEVTGDLRVAAAICMRSRTASRVLWPLTQVPAQDADGLHAAVRALPWEEILAPDASIAIGFDGTSDSLRNTRFSALRIKDGIVDRTRDVRVDRPNVDREDPDMRLHGVLHRGRVTLHIDLAGEALHRRGWRSAGGEAPLKENLAAAVLLRAGLEEGAGGTIADPMCGSGTLLVEGALLLAGVAPGQIRESFGWDAWLAAPDALTEESRAGLAQDVREVGVFGRDADPRQVERTREHLAAAGFASRFPASIDVDCAPVGALGAFPDDVRLIATNPPWGRRLDAQGSLHALGACLRQQAGGHDVAVLVAADTDVAGNAAGDADLRDSLERLDLPAMRIHALRSGALEVRLLAGRIADSDEDADERGREHARMFLNRVRKNFKRLGRWARREGIDAWRLYDRDLPEYAFAVDLYGAHCMVQEFEAPPTVDPVLAARRRKHALTGLRELLTEIAGIDPDCVHERVRQRHRGGGQYARLESDSARHEIEERGARLLVDMTGQIDTGLYLDSRGVRRRVRDAFAARGEGTFLNLFAYTCSATVHAALAGARSSVSVDLSARYLDWGRANLSRNGITDTAHQRVSGDVRAWLAGDPTGAGYDVVLLDPPTFSNSAAMDGDLDLQRDHGALLDLALARVKPGGLMLFVVHARRFRLQWQPPEGCEMEEVTRSTLEDDCARGRPAHRCWEIRRPH